MKTESFNHQVIRATKWSGITEVIAKLVTPISSMVLARVLTPEAFGVVATIIMVISFAELFTDAGFQKYLIQHEFKDQEDLVQSTNVAFWSNLIVSLFLWFCIIVWSKPIVKFIGSPGYELVLIVACVSIPLEAFSSIQMALFRRNLDFKTLFRVRVVSVLVPLVVTIPLAMWLRSYWALIWGMIVQNVLNAILLTVFSQWKPNLYFSFLKLKRMFSFTIWSLFEAVSIWLTSYVDIFLVSIYLSQHYLGLYKTAITVVDQIMLLVTAATTPVLFSSLSRLQDNQEEYRKMFFKFQKYVGIFVIPLGFGVFCFSDLITMIFLGEQWSEIADFIGLWGLTSSVTIIYSHYASEVYRSMGRPLLSVLAQWLHILVLLPAVLISIRYGFETLYSARALVRFELIMVNMVIIYYVIRISPLEMLRNTYASLVAAFAMLVIAFFLRNVSETLLWQLSSLGICFICYFMILALFPEERRGIVDMVLIRK